MVTRKLTYSDAGVDRDLRAESKKALRMLKRTYGHSRYGKVVELPYGNIFPFHDCYLDLAIEGVGTKVLVAQLAGEYDTIGIDGVAMAVNDVIRSGAKPIAVADNIHAQVSDHSLVKGWIRGISKAADESECIVPSGEIGDVADIIIGLHAGKGFDMVVAAIGEVTKEEMISGRNINPGDSIIGLKSSGLHSNGISLARRVLFKQWGGKYEAHAVPDGLERELVREVLEPTRIYVKPFLRLTERLKVKAAVHITGDAYLKFGRLAISSQGIGFEFDNFKQQPIFDVVQRTASELKSPITDKEMFRTFNMGWGFAVILEKPDADEALDILNMLGVESEQVGNVTSSGGIRIFHKGKKMILG